MQVSRHSVNQLPKWLTVSVVFICLAGYTLGPPLVCSDIKITPQEVYSD